MSRLADVMETYRGSDAERTRALYAELEALGPVGVIATNLFRAQKASARAKAYKGSGYKGEAYRKKQWSMNNLCDTLNAHDVGLRWGWGLDPLQVVHRNVLYVDLPSGQVSFHSEWRSLGPDYAGEWDGCRDASADRIVRWVAQVLEGVPA
jgi:hypothetical protein